jgi:hypothetical protein
MEVEARLKQNPPIVTSRAKGLLLNPSDASAGSTRAGLAAYSLALEDLAEARSAARDSLREAIQPGQVEQAARLLGYCNAW